MAGSDFWSMPIGSRPDPTMQGELPGPVYRDAAGNMFQVAPQSLPQMQPVERPQPSGPMKAMKAAMPMGNWTALGRAMWEGLTAPRRAMQGEPVTYGETFGTAMDAMGGGAFSTAPKGALRSGPIRAYHGSPHDFDRFDMGKIGTGEGAQAYGHGLYFAEAEDVARSYRDKLRYPRSDGASSNLRAVVADDLNYHNGSVDAVRASYENMAASPKPETAAYGKAKLELLDEVVGEHPGRMYEVSINADPDDFLDWDAPLSEQPNIAKKLGVDPNAHRRRAEEIRRSVAEDMRLDGRTEPDSIDLDRLRLAEEAESLAMTGDAASYAPRSQQMVDDLRAKGIPGVKYRDQMSRGMDGTATGTRNYVVFDDSIISIIRKYGIAAAAPMLGLTVEELRSQMEAQGI